MTDNKHYGQLAGGLTSPSRNPWEIDPSEPMPSSHSSPPGLPSIPSATAAPSLPAREATIMEFLPVLPVAATLPWPPLNPEPTPVTATFRPPVPSTTRTTTFKPGQPRIVTQGVGNARISSELARSQTAAIHSALTYPESWDRRSIVLPDETSEQAGAIFQKLLQQTWCPPMRSLAGVPPMQQVDVCSEAGSVPLADMDFAESKVVYRLLTIIDKVLEALEWIHHEGLTAGQLSAESIRVSPDGGVKLVTVAGAEEWPPLAAKQACQRDIKRLGNAAHQVLTVDGGEGPLHLMRNDVAPLIPQFVDWISGRQVTVPVPESVRLVRETLRSVINGAAMKMPWQPEAKPVAIVGERLLPEAEDPKKKKKKKKKRIRKPIEWKKYLPAAKIGGMAAALGLTGWFSYVYIIASPSKKSLAKSNEVLEQYINQAGDTMVSSASQAPTIAAAPRQPTAPSAPASIASSAEPARVRPRPVTPALEVVTPTLTIQERQQWRKVFSFPAATVSGEFTAPVKPAQRVIEDSSAHIKVLGTNRVIPFPSIGKTVLEETSTMPLEAMPPGDYYVVQFCASGMFIDAEAVKLQQNVVRSSQFCGVQLLTWVVLPNAWGAVVRVPAPRGLSATEMARRFQLLPDSAAAATRARAQALLAKGDQEGAQQQMEARGRHVGSVNGFVTTVNEMSAGKDGAAAFQAEWKKAPYRLSKLKNTAEIQEACAIIDQAPVKAEFVRRPAQWHLSGYGVAVAGYRTALEGLSKVMEADTDYKKADESARELVLTEVLRCYGIMIGDLPKSTPVAAKGSQLSGLPKYRSVSTKLDIPTGVLAPAKKAK